MLNREEELRFCKARRAAEEAAQATASPAPETGTPAQSTEPAPDATGSGAQ